MQCKLRIPTRFWLGCMTFCATMFSYLIQSNMSLTMLAMAEPSPNATETVPDFGPRYPYTAYEQTLIVGAFYVGSTLFTAPVGLLVDRFDCVRLFVAASTLLCGCLVALIPTMAGSVALMCATRLVLGVALGATFPLMHKLFDRWSPPTELGRFGATLLGGAFGTIVGWAVSGALIETTGWESTFYTLAAVAVTFATVWWLVAYDSPAQHPRIRSEERAFIERSLAATAAKGTETKRWPPLWRILTSVPVWSLILLQFGNLWGVAFILISAPRFMNEFLGFTVAGTGFTGSLPYIARILCATALSPLGDFMRKRGWMSLMNLRRLFCVIAHVIPGVLVGAIPFAGRDNPYVCIGLMTASFAFNGAITHTVFANIHDLSPNNSASLLAVANSIGTTTGFIAPLVATYFTENNNTIEGWRSVFLIGAAVYIVPAVVFMVLGSASVQSWNEMATTATDADGDSEATVAVNEGMKSNALPFEKR